MNPHLPYHNDRNWVSERMVRTVEEMATSMLAQAGLPSRYWSEAVNTATHLRNWLISKASLTGMTASFTLYPQGKEDKINHLKSLSCLCFAGASEEEQRLFTSDKGLSSDGLWTQFDLNLQGDGRRNEACLPYPHCELWWGKFSRVALCYFKPPYRNETRVDRVPEQLADDSALPPFKSGIDSGNEEPKGGEKHKNAPIDNDYSSKLRERTMTQGESQRDLAIGRVKTREKVLIGNCLQAYHKAMS